MFQRFGYVHSTKKWQTRTSHRYSRARFLMGFVLEDAIRWCQVGPESLIIDVPFHHIWRGLLVKASVSESPVPDKDSRGVLPFSLIRWLVEPVWPQRQTASLGGLSLLCVVMMIRWLEHGWLVWWRLVDDIYINTDAGQRSKNGLCIMLPQYVQTNRAVHCARIAIQTILYHRTK